MSIKHNQVSQIHYLSKLLGKAKIEHHFDGSTAKFIHNEVDSMNDIDIVFPFSTLESVKILFSNKELVEEIWDEELKLHHFKCYEGGEQIHFLFYKETKCSFYDYHELVNFEGEQVWVKGMKHFID